MNDCDLNVNLSPSYKALTNELALWARIKKFPLNATLELTPYCNLRCPMCYVRLDPATAVKQGKVLSGKQWLEILRQARDMGLLRPTLTGGEPLLHPDFWEIYNGATELGLLPTIYTNGCLIDEAVVERFKANPPLNIKISLYGASNETYETMCGVKNGFDKVSHAIDLLREAGIEFYCTATIVKENVHDMEALYRFAGERQLRFFHTFAVANSVRGVLNDPTASRFDIPEEAWSLEALEKQMRPTDEFRPFVYCPGYQCTFVMSWRGHMLFCAFAPNPHVKLEEPYNVEAAWQELLRIGDTIMVPEECHTCEARAFCARCPGLLASESGDPCRATPEFCQKAKNMYALYLRRKAEKENADAAVDSTKNDP